MKRHTVLASTILTLAILLAASPALAQKPTTSCSMTFQLKGWSAIYQTANGSGTITCDNGQTASVKIDAKGGGLTASRYEINDGHGKFTAVTDIRELFGSYAAASASVGVAKAGELQVVTKGTVTLGLAGSGNGVGLGVSVGEVTLSRK